MKQILKKIFMFTSILGVITAVAGCSHHGKKSHKDMKYVQTHEEDNTKSVSARMFTHSSGGGETRMGHIRFHETEAGLKMAVDLKYLHPGVEYKINVYDINQAKKSDKTKLHLNMPTLKAGNSGVLDQTYMITGLSAADLKNTKIVLSREGSDKAGWGKLEHHMFY